MASLAESLQALVDGSKHQAAVSGKLDRILANQERLIAVVDNLSERVARLEATATEKVADADAIAGMVSRMEESI